MRKAAKSKGKTLHQKQNTSYHPHPGCHITIEYLCNVAEAKCEEIWTGALEPSLGTCKNSEITVIPAIVGF